MDIILIGEPPPPHTFMTVRVQNVQFSPRVSEKLLQGNAATQSKPHFFIPSLLALALDHISDKGSLFWLKIHPYASFTIRCLFT